VYAFKRWVVRRESEKQIREAMISHIIQKMSKINLLYVKMFQWVTHDSIYVDENIQRIFRNITDHVAYEESSIDRRILEIDPCLQIDETPINAGTIAVVFQGVFISGEHVGKKIVVKVLKNGIEEKLKEAVAFFLYISRFMRRIPYLCDLQMDKILLENEKSLLSQTDFHKEAITIDHFFETFGGDNSVFLIPKVYKEFSNERRIVMRFIKGVNAFTLYPISDQDKFMFSNLLNQFMFSCLFEHGLFHGDMHPGNVMFEKTLRNKVDTPSFLDYDYRVGFVDFGIVYKIERETQKHIFYFLQYVTERKWEKMYRFLLDKGIEWEGTPLSEEEKSALLQRLLESREKYDLFYDNIKLNDYTVTNGILKQYNAKLCIEFTRFFMFLISMFSLLKIINLKKSFLFRLSFIKFVKGLEKKGKNYLYE
jgi:predicted unusual protein kinase regulating ubiquinone biosynthesis (AarF/ABC1/UbiB family)